MRKIIIVLMYLSYCASSCAMLKQRFSSSKIVTGVTHQPTFSPKYCSVTNYFSRIDRQIKKDQVLERFTRLARYTTTDDDNERGGINRYGIPLLVNYLKTADKVISCGGINGRCCILPELIEQKKLCLQNSYVKNLKLYESVPMSFGLRIQEFTLSDFHEHLVLWIKENTEQKTR